MSETWLVLGIVGVWTTIGLALSLIMGRRGHDPFAWGVLGALLGPLGIILALVITHEVLGPMRLREVAPGRPGGGPVDVLVGIDGSPEARAAAAQVEQLFGPRLGRVTLATVIPHRSGREDEDPARIMLQEQAGRMAGSPALDVLEGHPSKALERLAMEGGYHLLVIGTRGTGRSKALLGSAATEVARQTTVPVLLVGADPASTVPAVHGARRTGGSV